MAAGGAPGGDVLLDCNACDGALFFLPDAYPLVFRCHNGHFLTLGDLLDRLLSRDPGTSATVEVGWTETAVFLHKLAARALQCGHAFAAADFQDAATRVDRWVITLRTLVPGGGTTFADAPKVT